MSKESRMFRRYRAYRDMGMELNSKIMSRCVDKGRIGRAARMLGIADGRGKLAFRSKAESHMLMDFAMCDVRGEEGGRTPVQEYMEDPGPADDIERILLEARIDSRTSLFRVEAADAGGCTVDLSDLLRPGEGVTITDRNLSATLPAGYAVFVRLFTMPELSMTSGITFPFDGDRTAALVRRYEGMRSRPGRRGPASRYALFFRMHRRYGVPVDYVGWR